MLQFHKLLMCVCVSVPTALRVNVPTNSLAVDGRPPLLSPSQVSLGPQGQGYRTADLGDSPGRILSEYVLCGIFNDFRY